MDRLRDSLGESKEEIEQALAAARQELEELDRRRAGLVEMIRRAGAILGVSSGTRGDRTLHEALALILEERENEWTHVGELATEVNRRGLYTRRDGGLVQPNQVHARTKNYDGLFEKDGPMVRLRTDGASPVRRGAVRSKYDALAERLADADGDEVVLSFEELDQIVGGLPQSAYDHPAWWANESRGSHVQARAWMGTGWRVARLDAGDGWVRFERIE